MVFDEPIYSDNCATTPVLQTMAPLVGGSLAEAAATYRKCWIALDACGNVSDSCCQNIVVQALPEPDPFCGFTCSNWTASCLEDPNREISTTPACLRDDHFHDVFPNGLKIGSHSAPSRYTVLWTSAQAVEDFKCGYGLPAALTRDYVDPSRGQLGSIYGEILALRLNREFSCSRYFSDLGYQAVGSCYGSFVIPPEVMYFAGLTVDQFLAVADQALSGNTSALIPYGNSNLRLQSAAAYLNWLFGNCSGYGTRLEQPPAFANDHGVQNVADATPGGAAMPLPERFSMTSQPNPLHTSVILSLALPADGNVSIEIYDIQGRKIVTVLREHKNAGYHNVAWKGTDDFGAPVVSGVYFCRVQIDGQLVTMQKLMKL